MVFFTFSMKVDRVNLQINIFRHISWSIQAFLVFLAFLTFLVDLLRLKDLGNPHESLMAFAGLITPFLHLLKYRLTQIVFFVLSLQWPYSQPVIRLRDIGHILNLYHKYGRRPKDQSRPCYFRGSINNVTLFL